MKLSTYRNHKLNSIRDVEFMTGRPASEVIEAVNRGELHRYEDGSFTNIDVAGWHEHLSFMEMDSNSFYYPIFEDGGMHLGDINPEPYQDLTRSTILNEMNSKKVAKYCFYAGYQGALSAVAPLWLIDERFADFIKKPAVCDYADLAFKGKKWIPYKFSLLIRPSVEIGLRAHRDASWFKYRFRRSPMCWLSFDLTDPELSDGGPRYEPKSNRNMVDGRVTFLSDDVFSYKKIGQIGKIYCYNTGLAHGTTNHTGITRYSLYLGIMTLEEALYSRRPDDWVDNRKQVMEKLCLW